MRRRIGSSLSAKSGYTSVTFRPRFAAAGRPLIAASEVPWTGSNQVPRAMTRADMDEVIRQFVAATRRGADAGFDMLELHAAHGYLVSSFITPLMNRRDDEYGGSLDNRLRFPLELFRAMRAAWPDQRPMSVRISSNDWAGDRFTNSSGPGPQPTN